MEGIRLNDTCDTHFKLTNVIFQSSTQYLTKRSTYLASGTLYQTQRKPFIYNIQL